MAFDAGPGPGCREAVRGLHQSEASWYSKARLFARVSCVQCL